ncbi:MAG TPA: biotin--[acetyl-CoA-carboxylase] ligase, partial [Saprospiraceae bacterium]|nr:biotin--[acetyl-CoA-carboxylase] ligase [Saprospiraceae bacterium]
MSNINNSLFVGKVRVHFASLNSTNSYALKLLSKNNPSEGTVITAEKQLQGRGQIGSMWESEAKKNILASFILYPKFLHARK